MPRELTTAEPACPVCAGATEEFLRRPGVPVHQNLLLGDRTAACAVRRGMLAMRVCRGCGFVFNAAFDARLLEYGPDYDNSQSHSPAFTQHVADLVRELVEERGVRNCRVVEVGCGKGTFLRQLAAYPGGENVCVGFDPSYAGPPTEPDGRVRFCRRFFDEGAGVTADVVICRHVIEHVADPLALLRSMHAAVAGSPRACVFFETPCVDWILRQRVTWDFFYEHCSLFTADALAGAFAAAGFMVKEVRHLFGGQYLWLEGRPAEARALPGSGQTVELARQFAAADHSRVQSWRRALDRLAQAGPVAVWGAGAKGVTFCNLADPAGERVACVVDVNPAKQGKYLAGTGHPIVAPEQAVAAGVVTALVLNPNYVGEVADDLARRGARAAVLDLMRAA